MKIEKIQPTPQLLLDFAAEGLEALGALCERTWHDCLHVVAEGSCAASLGWSGQLAEASLRFPEQGASAPDPQRDVFPGCPLTFRLAEALWLRLPQHHRAVLSSSETKPPLEDVFYRAWARKAPPHAGRPAIALPVTPGWHFTLVASVRCEIQAIDQHWSLHQVALRWPDGEPDPGIEQEIAYLGDDAPRATIPWPAPNASHMASLIERGLRGNIDLQPIRRRQERFLKRELDRVDAYFFQYRRELEERQARARKDSRARFDERLAAAKDEHIRRRNDQVHRHEISVTPHVDAVLWVAELAWSAQIRWIQDHQPHEAAWYYVPRLRQWVLPDAGLPANGTRIELSSHR